MYTVVGIRINWTICCITYASSLLIEVSLCFASNVFDVIVIFRMHSSYQRCGH